MALRTLFCAGRRSILMLLALTTGACALSAQETPRHQSPLYRFPEQETFQIKELTPRYTGRPTTTPFQVQKAPAFAVKTNLVYWATASPNLGLEFGLGNKTTLDLSGGFNPWTKDEETITGDEIEIGEKKLKHWLGRAEFKYWLKERFDGHYFGVQAFYADYDVHGYTIPDLLEKEFYNEGTAWGGGVSYGYHWVWSPRWGMEFNAGLGILQMDYKEKTCDSCSESATRIKKTFFGPISAGVKLIFVIR